MHTKTLVVIPGLGTIGKQMLKTNLERILPTSKVTVALIPFRYRHSIKDLESQISEVNESISSLPAPVSIFGASAGGLVGLKILHRNPEIYKLITFRTPVAINGISRTYLTVRRHRDLIQYIEQETSALSKERAKDVMSLAASGDWLVRPYTTKIPGAKNITFRGIGHAISANTGINTCRKEICEFL